MRILIASDIHGSAKYCRLLIEAFHREKAEKLLLLGDILYHGPRNPLPEEYDTMGVVGLLNEIKDSVLCVCGNCDAEIDRMLLPFPVVSELGVVCVDGINIYFAHGHKETPALAEGNVYLTGHTHIPLNVVEDGHYHLNPGSVALPKEDSGHGYIVYEDKVFVFKTLDGKEYDRADLNEKVPEPIAVEPLKPVVLATPRTQTVKRKIVIRRK